MSLTGVNLAVTHDGEQYNKLKRPDHPTTSTRLPPTEASKRSFDEANLSHVEANGQPYSKRSRVRDSSSRRPKNTDSGMQSMLYGLTDEADSSDETLNEALAYLRSVRSEAESIPHLLVATPRASDDVAPDRSIYNDGRGAARAIFEDGAWIAREPISAGDSGEDSYSLSDDLEPQEQYYKKLRLRYQALRRKLGHPHQEPGEQMGAKLSDKKTASVLPRNRHEWLYILDREYPTPALIAQIQEHEVFQGLKYCAQSLDRFKAISKIKSCWIWSLLAKAPESGNLDYTRAGSIRDLGHKAGQFGMRLRSGISQSLESDNEEDDAVEWKVDCEEMNEEDEDSSNSEGPPKLSQAGMDKEPKAEADVESGAEMSISEEEGEVPRPDEPKTLEEARARLLAQIGDRLVQREDASNVQTQSTERGRSHSPSSEKRHRDTSSSSSRSLSPKRGPRHRHNGKYCFNPSCAPSNKRHKPHPKSGKRDLGNRLSRIRSPSTSERPVLSRAEAEAQRQRLREQELAAPENEGHTKSSEKALEARKPFASRADAEHHRQHLSAQEPRIQRNQKPEAQEVKKVNANSRSDPKSSDTNMPVMEIPDLNSRVTVDMILTVVAECYGQKDLLRYRDIWDG